ncbi:MAG: hypothetical protein RAO92_08800 [Candidatus Euphemobacter frigidus]|nr:hypothetical protein [Candidatus Euphemobacter frigidus]MDP8276486.1 hypothetical protein [Candidatus Euphemobacter frigidus]
MKRWAWVLSLLMVVAFSGCIKMEQDITLNKDGSGSVEFMYAMSEQTINQMKAMAQMGKQEGEEAELDDNQFEFDEAKVKSKFEAMKEQGIVLKNVETTTKGGWKYMNIAFDFKDISKLNDAEAMGDSPITITKNADGNYVITSKMSGDEMGGGEADTEQMKAMLPMLAGMRVAMKIHTPGAIISTTAPIKGKDTAEWIFDVDKDPDSVLNMSKSKMEIVFDGKGCTIPEVK